MVKTVKVNLIPPEIKSKRETERYITLLVIYTIVLLTVFILASLYVRLGISSERAKLDSLESQNAALEAQIANYKEFEKKKEDYLKLKGIYDTLYASKVSWYRFLIEIALITPEQISIKNINVDESSCLIQAESLDVKVIADYLIRLEELNELEDVWLDDLNIQNEKVSFTVKATFKPQGGKVQ
ncbi:MAG: hypothetical protein N2440_05415 [Actinobacteria bacterium]|nr:hypothetical protein [Actinomycetota bacterium]